MPSTILIIGAGATGLAAARRLAVEGFVVTVLEASAIPGGRIHTLATSEFSGAVEAGAEFVHGDLPITLGLAEEAGVALMPTSYSQLTTDEQQRSDPSDWSVMMEAMARLEKDIPVAEFLETYFSGQEYDSLRRSVKGYAEGYDLADLSTASTRALYSEWSDEEDSTSYRVEGGYGRLVDYLVRECGRLGAVLHLDSPVKEVWWREGRVEVRTAGDTIFRADRLIVTASLGALSRIVFDPRVPEVMRATAGIGYGSVIKILMEFRSAFWRTGPHGSQTLFILSRQLVPTWWTQGSDNPALLTGWLTGENMRQFRMLDPDLQTERCLSSLAGIFSREPEFLRNELKAFRIFDWELQPFVHGGYSYDTVKTPECREVLQRPVEGTLYFAGEAIYKGSAPGTVEAALHSGIEVAEKIIARH